MSTETKYRYLLAVLSLIVGATLLVVGGKHGDVVTQTAGGTVIAAVVGVIGYRKATQEKE